MKNIKLFEAYFDRSDVSYEVINYSQLYIFQKDHKLEDINRSEVRSINILFNSNIKATSYKSTSYGKAQSVFAYIGYNSDKLTNNEVFYPLYVYKYEDGWWVFILAKISMFLDGIVSKIILCDGLEGIEEYKKAN